MVQAGTVATSSKHWRIFICSNYPPHAPELNPIEHVRDELREKFFHNRVFNSLYALKDHLAKALKTMELDLNKSVGDFRLFGRFGYQSMHQVIDTFVRKNSPRQCLRWFT